MKHFWNWVRNDDDSRTLYLNGVIAEESWFADDITPAMFKEELFAGSGPITLHISSPGGDCVAASQIYTMLMDYPHDVNVQIDGLAASAASVIAMAGTHVAMSPTSMMMIHNPFTIAMGDSGEMRKAIQLLDEVKESIINAYQIKTGLSRTKLAHLMDSETWMNAKKAVELGFCDEVLYTDSDLPDDDSPGFSYAEKSAANNLMNRVLACVKRNTTTFDQASASSSVSTALAPIQGCPLLTNMQISAGQLVADAIDVSQLADGITLPDITNAQVTDAQITGTVEVTVEATVEGEAEASESDSQPETPETPDTRVKASDLKNRLMLLK